MTSGRKRKHKPNYSERLRRAIEGALGDDGDCVVLTYVFMENLFKAGFERGWDEHKKAVSQKEGI